MGKHTNHETLIFLFFQKEEIDMKLIESPINKNINLETTFPNISKFIFDHTAIKYYKIYTLDRIQVLYIDTYDKIRLILVDSRRKITDSEVDFAIANLLMVDKSQLKIDADIKDRLVQAGAKFHKPVKDILLITKEVADQ